MTSPGAGELQVADLVERFALAPHPEGGFYRETFRSNALTAIYYLLPAGEFSAWHRVDKVETWHRYAGSSLDLYWWDGGLQHVRLGLEEGEVPQATIPAGCPQAAIARDGWVLCGCTVAPAFVFDGFEMLGSEQLPLELPAELRRLVR